MRENLATRKRQARSDAFGLGPCPRCKYDLRATRQDSSGSWLCPECGGSWTSSAFVAHTEQTASPLLMCGSCIAVGCILTLGTMLAVPGVVPLLALVAVSAFAAFSFLIYSNTDAKSRPLMRLLKTAAMVLAVFAAVAAIDFAVVFVYRFINTLLNNPMGS